jgi:hypothetical protein
MQMHDSSHREKVLLFGTFTLLRSGISLETEPKKHTTVNKYRLTLPSVQDDGYSDAGGG